MESIPFFKIDCEGCEYSVIPTFTDEQWDKIQVRPSLPHSSCVCVCGGGGRVCVGVFSHARMLLARSCAQLPAAATP